ncbi:MAG: flagellin-like protein [Oscillospiraceae bacterium]|jgi:hypothetical protein|nr:flagellin-like protein [Oscillospiraceae bacterium]
MLNMLIAGAALAKAKLREFLAKEDGEVNIVAIVVLIGIAIVLAILFRGYITNLLKTLFGQVENTASNAIGE